MTEAMQADSYGETWAAVYDDEHQFMDPEPAVALLSELANGRPTLELGIGTGRVALPLRVRGVDVSGLTLVAAVNIPGNILAGNFRQMLFVDDQATEEQAEAMLDAFTGKLGGPLGDLAQLVGERVAIERASISHEIVDGAGTLKVDDKIHCEMHPYKGPDGSTTTLNNSIFSTVPGSPAYVGKADSQRIDIPEHGYQWSYEDKNAIQSDWKLDYRGD